VIASVDLKNRPVLIIIKHFHKLKAAEHEVVERLAQSTRDLGWEPRIINVDSDFNISNIAKYEDGADLVLDIHYEYPKFFKPRSIGAVWTPTSFMKEWDLAYVWENQLSHDALVHTDSNLVSNLLSQYRPQEDFEILNHSLPSSWLEWVNKGTRDQTPRVFYAGINWSKLSGRPGRHHEFFKFLDNKDVLDIYGPKKIAHVTPWKDFTSYRGEIPFDGKSLLLRARESGISLVLSSHQHLNEEIISSRLFEGLFAGNAIISDRHPFIQKHLGENAFYLDFDRGDEYAASQLVDYVEELRGDQDLLHAKQVTSQQLYLKEFDLTKQLKELLAPMAELQMLEQDLDALVIGSSTSGILGKLQAAGFNRIEFTTSQIIDLQDLVTVAQSFDLRKFCVFSSNSQILDSFVERLQVVLAKLTSGFAEIGVLGTVALSQIAGRFSPVTVPAAKSLPLSGLIIDLDHLSDNPRVYVDPVVSVRVKDLAEIRYISTFLSPYQFLLKRLDGDSSTRLGDQSVRQIILTGLAALSTAAASDIAEEIRRMPRARKRATIYALLGSIPILKPIVLIAKWIIRKQNN
jgi:hypothetical protein